MTRKKSIRIGVDDFSELRGENGYFVDKTPLIREVIDGAKVTLLPRPRRFGKTLNLSMLRYFFERVEDEEKQAERRALFDGLRITQDADAMEHFGRHPTISLTLKDVKGETWDAAYQKLLSRIADLCKGYHSLQAGLPEDDRQQFERLRTRQAGRAEVEDSLKNLVSWLHTVYEAPVVVLLDEYDSPAIEASRHGYLEQMLDFLRAWLGAGLKHEYGPALYRTVVTGILRIAKESIFSGLNNLKVCTTLFPNRFSDKFGFTEEEVGQLLRDYECFDRLSEVQEWYNGYVFGGRVIYNPWSVLSYVDDLPAPAEPKWLNTASSTLVYEELQAGGPAVQRDLEKLLAGEELRYPIREDTVFSDAGRNPENIRKLAVLLKGKNVRVTVRRQP